jgi:hypothetical protein
VKNTSRVSVLGVVITATHQKTAGFIKVRMYILHFAPGADKDSTTPASQKGTISRKIH